MNPSPFHHHCGEGPGNKISFSKIVVIIKFIETNLSTSYCMQPLLVSWVLLLLMWLSSFTHSFIHTHLGLCLIPLSTLYVALPKYVTIQGQEGGRSSIRQQK